jgi:peptide/nickel transport system permease protein
VLARLIRNGATAVATLAVVSLVVFALASLAPGDPTSADGESAPSHRLTAEQRAEIRALYHLDDPLHRRFFAWLVDVLRGELGRSFHDRRPVSEKIAAAALPSILLNGIALIVMVAAGFLLGAAAALRPGSLWDRLLAGLSYSLVAAPVFWTAILLQMLFSVTLGWLPLYGLGSADAVTWPMGARLRDVALHLALPVVCVAYTGIAYLGRFVRGVLIDSASAEVTRAGRARGLSAFAVLLRHGSRQAAVPMLTLAGFLLPRIVGGAVLVETVFAIPGLGRLFVEAMFERDTPVLMGLTLLSGAATLAGVFLADLAHTIADPRIRRA